MTDLRIKWRFALPTLFTLAAMLAGFFSIIAAAEGEYLLAAQLILISMLLDGLDGTLARALHAETKFGAELDTFVDITSFGLAPAVLLYQLMLKDSGWWGMVMVSAYALSGAIRLSRFRVVDPFRGQHGYLGLPITVAAGWVAAFVIMVELNVLDDAWFALDHGPVAAFFWTSTIAMILLQVSHVRYGKPTKNPLSFIPFAILLMVVFMHARYSIPAACALCAYGFHYAFLSPIFRRRVVLVSDPEEEKLPVRHP